MEFNEGSSRLTNDAMQRKILASNSVFFMYSNFSVFFHLIWCQLVSFTLASIQFFLMEKNSIISTTTKNTIGINSRQIYFFFVLFICLCTCKTKLKERIKPKRMDREDGIDVNAKAAELKKKLSSMETE